MRADVGSARSVRSGARDPPASFRTVSHASGSRSPALTPRRSVNSKSSFGLVVITVTAGRERHETCSLTPAAFRPVSITPPFAATLMPFPPSLGPPLPWHATCYCRSRFSRRGSKNTRPTQVACQGRGYKDDRFVRT